MVGRQIRARVSVVDTFGVETVIFSQATNTVKKSLLAKFLSGAAAANTHHRFGAIKYNRKPQDWEKHLIICGFLYFSLSPKEKSRHTISRMKQAWLYQFVDFRRGQRPNRNLTFIHPHNVSSIMEYCHAHDRS